MASRNSPVEEIVTIYSNPVGGANSEGFGLGAIFDGDNCCAYGNGADAGPAGADKNTVSGRLANADRGDNNTITGYNARLTVDGVFNECSLHGSGSISTGHKGTGNGYSVSVVSNSTASGRTSRALAPYSCTMGSGSQVDGDGTSSMALGAGAWTKGYVSTINLGRSSTGANDNTFGVGSPVAPITSMYVGESELSASPGSLLFSGTNGSGTDISSGSLTIAPGRPTGDANGGDIIFQTVPDGGSSSASLRSLVTALTIDSEGSVAVGSALLATDATAGFLYIPCCEGTPTGTPTARTGCVPIVIDVTNNDLCVYYSGSWKSTALAA